MKKNFFLWILLFVFLSTYNLQGKKDSNSGFFSIKNILIEGIKYSNKEKLEKNLNIIKNKNLIFLKNSDFDETIENIDFINSLEIKKIYPNKIKITVIEDFPIGVYLDSKGEKYILLENNKIIKNKNYQFEDLPNVYGDGANEKFSNFYSNLKKTELNLELAKQFIYHSINRWDLQLKDGKLIKLPPENYEKSVTKFLEIYEKSTFKKFKVYDFRIENELIMR